MFHILAATDSLQFNLAQLDFPNRFESIRKSNNLQARKQQGSFDNQPLLSHKLPSLRLRWL